MKSKKNPSTGSGLKQFKIGVDIGGTNMKAVLFDGEKVIEEYLLATPKDTIEHLVIMLNALVEPLKGEAKKQGREVSGVGICLPGTVDRVKNKILKAGPNTQILEGVNLVKLVEERIKLPVVIDNDARSFLRGEAMLGAGKGYSNIFALTLGTGVGGGWWFGNEAYSGFRNGAVEPGRMIIEFTQKIELEEAYKRITQGNPEHLAREAYVGDYLAVRSFEELGQMVGVALANVVNLIDPEVIVMGGGTMEASDLFFDEVKKAVKNLVMNPESKKIKILKSKLGDKAGAIGAALLV